MTLRLLRLTAFAAFALAALAAGASAQKRVPRFEDYPAKRTYIGRHAAVVLTPDNRAFRTRLREAAREKPNFAGRYVLTAWGCGTGCVLGAAVDLRTGRVTWLPDTLCCWWETEENISDDFEPIEFRLSSRLIIFRGMLGEKEQSKGTHFYKMENGRFVHLHSIPKTKASTGENL